MYRIRIVSVNKNKKIYIPEVKKGGNSNWVGVLIKYIYSDKVVYSKNIHDVCLSYNDNDEIFMTDELEIAKVVVDFLKNKKKIFIDDEYIYL